MNENLEERYLNNLILQKTALRTSSFVEPYQRLNE
jgi:hypothetical protein